MMVGLYDNQQDWHTAMQMGVANYGQMTAGGWMYIGPQGIVHGTFNTLLNAGRLKLGIPQDGDLRGRLFVSSGLGGMSGAQPKAAEMAGAAAIIAEVDASRIETRHTQGWVGHVTDSLEEAFSLAQKAMDECRPVSVAYHGNVVDLLEYAVQKQLHIDLLSDQTSCHATYEGGYCPVGLTFEQRTRMLHENPSEFRCLVNVSLERHFKAIKRLVEHGTYFFDYGNSFMKAVYDAGVSEIARDGDDKNGFIFPSYVEDIMGPELFDYGYGPFRWVCLSGKHEDLVKTDRAAMECIDPTRRGQDLDNYNWIRDAEKNNLVVGTQARILYQDAVGRMNIALRFNEMVRKGEVGPIMLGRDHHDVSGTDSPFRETSNIKDGSNVMADMAVQCFAGNCARGMSLVALHNGGGVGIGTAELTAGDQNSLVRAAGQQLTQHALCGRGAHGDHDHFSAGLILQSQSGLNGVQVVGVGDGGHRGTIQSTVCLDGDFAGGIRNLLYTNNCFHCKSCLPYFSSAPEMTIICTSLVPS